MSTQAEVQRLTEVYRNYRESGVTQARWSGANAGNRAIMRERTQVLARLLRAAGLLPLTDRRILDVGCGSGQVLAGLTQWGAVPGNLYGVDLLPDRVEEAKRRFPGINFRAGNAEQVDFPDGSFDLVLLYTVFTSVLNDEMARNLAAEVRRLTKPGGAVVWYDFRYNNPRNASVRGVTDRMIGALFPDFERRLQAVTLLPPLARRLGKMTPVMYPVLTRIPRLRTHWLGLLVKPASAGQYPSPTAGEAAARSQQ
jgi:SAM-dependent methyltransferase